MKTITIEPVTRIEGHAKISLFVDDKGDVRDAQFHVVEFRGFEKFSEGRPYWEMPTITARVCGICPVSHMLASAKACDAIMAVKVPPTAVKLRRLLHLGQLTQSHALSFFHLSSPDFLLGWDSDPAARNVFGLIALDANLAKRAVLLRKYGQRIIEILGAKRVHSPWAVPGGVASPLTEEGRAWIAANHAEAMATARIGLDLLKKLLDEKLKEEPAWFGDFPSMYMGLVTPEGDWEYYDGDVRLMDQDGKVVERSIPVDSFHSVIKESAETWSYMKFPYYAAKGPADGMYRVGPLARVNVCGKMGTPIADKELAEYRSRFGRVARSSLLYHYARLIELIASLEKIAGYVADPGITDTFVRANAGVNSLTGTGIIEAPRGTLIHTYEVDKDGLIRKANLIVATGHNNRAMNKTIAQIAKKYVKGNDVKEGMLNRVEAGIRCYDPCLSCATHAVGKMPMVVDIIGPDGKTIGSLSKN